MFRTLFILIFLSLLLQNCSKLNENFQGDLTSGGVGSDTVNTAALLDGVYNSLENAFSGHLAIFPLEEFTTDEALAPTRGSDWDDNGSWRVLHEQKWDASNTHIRDCFNALNGVAFTATDMLRYHPTKQQQAEARFIRAWVMYLLLDMFDQVPYREPGEDVVNPAKVRSGTDALNYIMNEIDSVESDLPDGPAYKANKYAAKFLLMKCYLNKGVFQNRANPVLNADDMNKVISLADEIINSNQFTLSKNYFDNFAPANTNIGTENIFTQLNQEGITPNNYLFSTWLMVLHYNEYPNGVNGFTTLSDFYNKFEASDKRLGQVYETQGSPPNPGHHINVGFFIGQQYDPFTDSPLTDRTGAPLIYTPEVHNIETGSNLEATGIRPLKYVPDYSNLFSPDNDLVYFRLSDALLMKAEAILHHGTPTNAGIYGNSALSIVNAIRTDSSRGTSFLSSVNLDTLYNERGRELWWEGWRREDMIRFGEFLKPFEEKDYTSDPKYLLFPIPNDQLAVNPYLKQNPGY